MADWEMQGRPALVILHMQQGIVGKRGNIPGLYQAVQDSGIIPRQQALLQAFRAKGLPVVFVRALHVTKAQDPCGVLPAYGNLCRLIEAAKETPDNLEIIPEVAPLPGEPVLTNWMIGAFTSSGLEEVLKARGAQTLVLAGCVTHIAVYAAALQAIDRWYPVIIARDACTVPPDFKKAEECVLEMLAPNIALVTSAEDVIGKIQGVTR
jgi:nicotinamidase-related amidase